MDSLKRIDQSLGLFQPGATKEKIVIMIVLAVNSFNLITRFFNPLGGQSSFFSAVTATTPLSKTVLSKNAEERCPVHVRPPSQQFYRLSSKSKDLSIE